MTTLDPFIEGMRKIFAMREDLKPSRVSVDAGLDNSTVRKLLSGANASPKVETAQKIADAMGIELATIIALGSHEASDQLVSVISQIDQLPEEELRELLRFVNYLEAKSEAASEPASEPQQQSAAS